MPNDSLEAMKVYQSKVEHSIEYNERFDILETINNVGNDEVFTPVETCKNILNLLPEEVWSNPNYKWLNPCDKNGVFLREIAIRLNEGLKEAIPNEEERKKHILCDMLYSIGLTKFTALVSRRTVYYCSQANRRFDGQKDKDGHSYNGYAIGNGTWFNTEEGNILSPITDHEFINGKCKYCRTAEKQNGEYGKYADPDQNEHYAYEFIHVNHLNMQRHLQDRFFKGDRTMKFDIIIGNPPYQLSDGGAQASATPIYNLFVDMARYLNPRYLCFIIESRWMSGGRNLDEFRESMITDKHIKKLVDYKSSKECFPAISPIKGGVCYFLWDREYNGKCNITTYSGDGRTEETSRYLKEGDSNTFIRDEKLLSIISKVQASREPSFKDIVSSQKPYGIRGFAFQNPEKAGILESEISEKIIPNSYKVYGRTSERTIRYISKNCSVIQDKMNNINQYKIFMPRNIGSGTFGEPISEMILGEPGSICTETFLSIGRFDNEQKAKNCMAYIKTKFFRALFGVMHNTQDVSKDVFAYVPIQDFSKHWTDAQLYEKYNLNQDEINYIEMYIEAMN